MGKKFEKILTKWKGIKASSQFKNFVLFLGFVILASGFWVIMSMNDNVQDTFDVQLSVVGVPDSVTFITDPPRKIHVSVRDKGTRLFRAAMNNPKLTLNFREYASAGILRFTSADLTSSLKSIFGSAAQITSVSPDSLSLPYTTEPGKRVPIIINADVQTESGKVIAGRLTSPTSAVRLYTTTVDLDTVYRVYTKKIIKRNLKESTTIEIGIQPIPGVKIVPSVVKVNIPVEPLVKKTIMAPITVKDLPAGYSLLLFPDNVEVSFFVPMSKFNQEYKGIEVSVLFEDALASKSEMVPLLISSYPSDIKNPTLKSDSVEYTIVR